MTSGRPETVLHGRGPRSRETVVTRGGLSRADLHARLAGVLTGVMLLMAAPAMAEHLSLDPGARRAPAPPLDADLSLRVDPDGFHIGGRLLGFGAWVRAQRRDDGVTLDGQLQGDRVRNFRIEGDTRGGWPRLRIQITPGTI